MSQLALPLQLADHAVFASFYDRGNEPLVATLRRITADDEQFGCWLWGMPATGKTHLLQAVCDASGDRAVYVPLQFFAAAGPGILEGLESREIICLDDLDVVAGDVDWETALFELLNQVFDAGGQVVAAASSAPRESAIALPDLASRLSRLPVFQLQPLDDDALIGALQLRSRHRGLELPDETAAFLLRRERRDMASLYEVLDKLDREALRAKRRLTVPFVRSVLENDSG